MRGYFYKRLKFRTAKFGVKYYLDFSPKADYYLFDDRGLPMVRYGAELIDFPVTVINFYLGKLDDGKFEPKDLVKISEYVDKHTVDGEFLFCHDFEEKNWKNEPIWFSNLPHAMLFSLLVRVGLNYDIGEYFNRELAYFYNSLFKAEIFDKENWIFLEYPSIQSQPLNGQLFGLFAVYDAYQNDMEIEQNYLRAVNASLQLLKDQITFFGWTKYNEYRLASPFYHFLHISQLKVCEKLDSRFLTYRLRAQIAVIFYPFVVVYKIIKIYFK
ncbi:D-glucuronyl C5-epimerase family protein [Schleiferiaceae bacterium]|nr:D-glucuronyl C5-epimerase family protein [Schleiferiaceae bacterium]